MTLPLVPQNRTGVLMLRSLKMYGMAQAVEDLIERGPRLSKPPSHPVTGAEGRIGRTRAALHRLSHEGCPAAIGLEPVAAHGRRPAYKDLAGLDFAARAINEATVRTLHRCAFLDGARNVILIGGPGTGKTHVAAALGIQAIEHHRHKVRFFSTIELVNAPEQEKAGGKVGQIAESLTRLDLPSSGKRSPGSFSEPRRPGRTRRSAVQRLGRGIAGPAAEQALPTHQRRDHHKYQLQRVGHGLW